MQLHELGLIVMSKDYRFRKEDKEDLGQQDWILGKQRDEGKLEETKAELMRKKRASKLMAQARSNHVEDTESVH